METVYLSDTLTSTDEFTRRQNSEEHPNHMSDLLRMLTNRVIPVLLIHFKSNKQQSRSFLNRKLQIQHLQVSGYITKSRNTVTHFIQHHTKTDHVLSINYTHLCVISLKNLNICIYLYNLHQIFLFLMILQEGILHSHLLCFTTLDLQFGEKLQNRTTLLQTRETLIKTCCPLRGRDILILQK